MKCLVKQEQSKIMSAKLLLYRFSNIKKGLNVYLKKTVSVLCILILKIFYKIALLFVDNLFHSQSGQRKLMKT